MNPGKVNNFTAVKTKMLYMYGGFVLVNRNKGLYLQHNKKKPAVPNLEWRFFTRKRRYTVKKFHNLP